MPFDPTPIARGITVYYGDMVYGRVSFAVVADRMFKSGPQGKVSTWRGRPDHIRSKSIDIAALDKPGLQLLGERQEKFLEQWAADWRGADMKMVLSQTIFCNLANYHGGNKMYLVADLDSIVQHLAAVDGIQAVVLGGSRALGTHTPDSDTDLGLYYDPSAPPDLDALQRVVAEIDDRQGAYRITPLGEWGPWINGGGWLKVSGMVTVGVTG